MGWEGGCVYVSMCLCEFAFFDIIVSVRMDAVRHTMSIIYVRENH